LSLLQFLVDGEVCIHLLAQCNKIRNCNGTPTNNQLLVQVHLSVSRNSKEANFEEQTLQLKGSVLVNDGLVWPRKNLLNNQHLPAIQHVFLPLESLDANSFFVNSSLLCRLIASEVCD
jgi:hypothetical protein